MNFISENNTTSVNNRQLKKTVSIMHEVIKSYEV